MELPSAENILCFINKEAILSSDDEGNMCYRVEFPINVSSVAYTFFNKPLPSFEEVVLHEMMESK